MYAHGGIVAAAAAILQDMGKHKLLQRLLEQYDPFDQQNLQPDQRYTPEASLASRNHPSAAPIPSSST